MISLCQVPDVVTLIENMSSDTYGPVVAELHPRESERLASLHSLNVLDKPSDERFDRVTTLATLIFNTPVALVTLVDKDRQWFLSRCGLDISETGRDVSFCAHALHEDVMLVVEDTHKDPRFAKNPFVVDPPYVRFYAGVVLRDNDGLPLGTLCVIATEPCVFSDRDRQMLIQLGAVVTSELLLDTAPMQQRVLSQLDANVDPLTRAFAPKRFMISVDEQVSDQQATTAVAKIVIPGLDQLNDIFGRPVGDELLVELVSRLSRIGKDFDSCSIGRLSGRRFGVCISGNTLKDPKYDLANVIECELSKPFLTTGGELTPDLHTGIAFKNSDIDQTKTLLERCRAALASAASTRGSQVVLYDESHLLPINRRLRIAAELQSAIDCNALHLMYQPKVRCADRSIDGFECLLRWQHDDLGSISPLDILDAASDVNKLVALDRWVIEQAIRQRANWKNAHLMPGTLSANITGETLLSPGFVSWLDETLAHHGVDAGEMELEVLESSLFDDFECAVKVLSAVQALGVSISLDDFGTGYSSLAHLYRLPISVLKIDRAFISRLEQDLVHKSLCNSILSMARDLAMSVVAEGVENEHQFAILKASNCDRVQGYLFSRPVSAEEAAFMLAGPTSGEMTAA